MIADNQARISGMRALFVDDEPSLLEQAKIFLERENENLNVRTMTSAEEALNLLKEIEFDAVISDYQMPGMDGLDFLKMVRDIHETIPFIVFTGQGREEVAMEALNLGADRYLQKGGDPRSQYGTLAHAIVQEVKRAKATENLKDVEEKYENFFKTSRDAVFIISKDGQFIDFNEATIDLLGYKNRAELKKVQTKDIYQNPSRRKELFEVIENKGFLEEFSVNLERKDGTTVETLITATPLKNKNNKLTGFQGTMRRVDGYEKEEATSGISIENLTAPTLVIDHNHEVCEWNKALENLTGIEKEEVVGTNEAWKGFFEKEKPLLANLLIEGRHNELNSYYDVEKVKHIPNGYSTRYSVDLQNGKKQLISTAKVIGEARDGMKKAVETLQCVPETKSDN